MTSSGRTCRIGQQPVAFKPCRLLEPGRGLAAAPSQRPVLDLERTGEPLHRTRLGGRLLPQAVVDGNRHKPWTAFARLAPARRKDEERRGVGPAGNGEDE